jgi:hypothetical protein
LKREFCRRVVASSLSLGLVSSTFCAAFSADSDLNFKLYSPDQTAQSSGSAAETNLDSAAVTDKSATVTDKANLQSESDVVSDSPGPTSPQDVTSSSTSKSPSLRQELPQSDSTQTSTAQPASPDPISDATPLHGAPGTADENKTASDNTASSSDTGAKAEAATNSADTSSTSTPGPSPSATANTQAASDKTANTENASDKTETTQKQATGDSASPDSANSTEAASTSTTSETTESKTSTTEGGSTSSGKVLQGYARVVPSGTKFPIVMDTAVDSDTSQEGDEFSARTTEDLTIDGENLVPAGSIIKGRIASLNAPKHLNRSGSVALKFDTITTPDNRQIPLVANLVARGGVVHAKRGLKDVAIDATEFSLPSAAGLGIGVIAGMHSSKIGAGGGALIGAGVGVALGVAILAAKKGKKVDVRPGDELKVELAEDLHMPTL